MAAVRMTGRKKRKKRRKLIPIPRLIKRVHDSWSMAVRIRDKFRCLISGSGPDAYQLNAHHWIARSVRTPTRFLVDNGATLCAHIHKYGAHGRWTEMDHDIFQGRMTQIVSPQRMEEIKTLSHLQGKLVMPGTSEVVDFSRDNLLRVEESLKSYIKEHQ